MTDQQKLQLAGLGGVALFAWWLFNQQGDTSISIDDLSDEELTYNPYDQTNPGIYDGNFPGFNSTINLELENPLLGSLSRQYIPLFGMIGVVATGIAPPVIKAPILAPQPREGLLGRSSRGRATGGRRGATIGNSGSAGGSRT